MLDRIDERDKQERMHRSIVKYWNVNYIPTPYVEPEEEKTGEKEAAVTGQQLSVEPEPAVSSANYGSEEVTDEVTKGQIDKILHEKTEAIRSLIEQNKHPEDEQDVPGEMTQDTTGQAAMTQEVSGHPETMLEADGQSETTQEADGQAAPTEGIPE